MCLVLEGGTVEDIGLAEGRALLLVDVYDNLVFAALGVYDPLVNGCRVSLGEVLLSGSCSIVYISMMLTAQVTMVYDGISLPYHGILDPSLILLPVF